MTRQVTNPDGSISLLDRYAQLQGDTVVLVIESEYDPDGVNGSWIFCPEHVGPGCTANFDRTEWYPAAVPTPPAKPYLHFIDKGPFNDRFGVKKLAVLMSTDPVIRAFNSDKSDREYIDLERLDVRGAVAYMAGIPLTMGADTFTIPTPILTQAELEHVLDLNVTTNEQIALVKKFFS